MLPSTVILFLLCLILIYGQDIPVPEDLDPQLKFDLFETSRISSGVAEQIHMELVDTESATTPTIAPSAEPTMEPTMELTHEPSHEPTRMPSHSPSIAPSVASTAAPTVGPTIALTVAPTVAPTVAQSIAPTMPPSQPQTIPPTQQPTISTVAPSIPPTQHATIAPSLAPSQPLTTAPTQTPIAASTAAPTYTSTNTPTFGPTEAPTMVTATVEPSAVPTVAPTTASPSREPTLRPSIAPSVSPAPSSAPVVQIAATQTITGISYSTYNTNPSLYEAVLKQTIADCLDGISPDDITNFVVTEVSRRLVTDEHSMAPLQLRSEGASHHRHLQTNAIRTSYVLRSSNPTLTYDTLSTQLESAVSTGVFDTILSENAQDAGATELVGCQSSDVSTVPLHTSSGSSSDGLSAGAIAGIVIGCVLGLGILLATSLYSIWRMKKVSPPEGQRNFELQKILPG